MPEPRENDGDLLASYLESNDAPCPGCGYNLRGIRVSVCPECKLDIRLSVQLADPRSGLHLASVAGLLMSAAPAAGFLAIAATLMLTVRNMGPPPRLAALVIFAWPTVVAIVLGTLTVLLALPRGRLWFRRRSAPDARRICAGCWGASGLAGLVYVAILVSFIH